jgi:exonuclease SbcC
LFEGRTPEQEEEFLQRHVDEARNAAETQQKAHEAAESEINQLRGQQLRAAEERQLKQNQLSANQCELDMWLLRFNRDNSPMQLAELDEIFSDRTDWKALRADLEEKKNALHLAKLQLDAAQRALIELQTKNYRPKREEEASQAYLITELNNVKQEIERQGETLSALRIMLDKHHNCIRDAEQLMADTAHLRKDYEHWASLCTIFGSHDGKKFRELAQSYTFDFLVEQANCHLRQLSPRYELRTQPGTLTLTVIDHDMFDEERHIQSLSGGETFVASLALALGLASLSSGQISIGSLFIDEGFGNLDQASLQLVMDALSRLETTQGRKVGVVSHTLQIREQIHPQIRVVKLPTGGKSRVEVR